MLKFQGSIKEKVEFTAVIKKNSGGISIGLGFLSWNFQRVSHNFMENSLVHEIFCFAKIKSVLNVFKNTNIFMYYSGEPVPQGKPYSSFEDVTYSWIVFGYNQSQNTVGQPVFSLKNAYSLHPPPPSSFPPSSLFNVERMWKLLGIALMAAWYIWEA